ncbi:unnamed protein product, partial [Pylaiella littoralis]
MMKKILQYLFSHRKRFFFTLSFLVERGGRLWGAFALFGLLPHQYFCRGVSRRSQWDGPMVETVPMIGGFFVTEVSKRKQLSSQGASYLPSACSNSQSCPAAKIGAFVSCASIALCSKTLCHHGR